MARTSKAQNLLIDPGAEGAVISPTGNGVSGWTFSNGGTFLGFSSNFARSGTNSIELAGAGGFGVPLAYQTFPASAGQSFTMTGFGLTPTAITGGGATDFSGLQVTYWSGPAGTGSNLGTVQTSPGNALFSNHIDSNSTAGVWIPLSVTATAPAGAQSVQGFVIVIDQTPTTTYFDDMTLEPASINNSYIDGTGKWETSNSWSLGVAPSTNDTADFITSTNRSTITIDSTTAGSFPSAMTINNLTISANTLQLTNVSPAVFQILNQFVLTTGASLLNNGGIFTIKGPAEIDQGTLTSASGTTQFSSNLLVGSSVNSTGTVNVTGGELIATNGIIGIGDDGTTSNGFGVGTMTVSNGTVLAGQILLGSCVGGVGTLNILTNGLVALVGTNAMLVADGTTVNITGGNLVINNGSFACGVGSASAIIMSGGTVSCAFLNAGFNNVGTLTMSAGQITVSSTLIVGGSKASGAGTVLMNGGKLIANVNTTIIGDLGAGTLTLNSGSTATFHALVLGANGGIGRVYVMGGTLNVPASSITVDAGVCSLCPHVMIPGSIIASPDIDTNGCSPNVPMGSNTIGQITISNGVVLAGSLVLTNGDSSEFAFPGGTLSSGGTVVSNNQLFLVGDGTDAATFQLNGGVHSFANNLEIANNSTLSGCGTIDGNAAFDHGGKVLANCGTLTFAGIVINNGTVQAINGANIEFDGPMVNDGVIDMINGGQLVFSNTFSNSGTLLNASSVVISSVARSNTDVIVKIQSYTGHTYQLEVTPSLTATNWTNSGALQDGTGSILTFTETGGATNKPGRFYRIDVGAK